MASTQGEQQRLPFFVYGTLCTGFLNWERFIKVLTPGAVFELMISLSLCVMCILSNHT